MYTSFACLPARADSSRRSGATAVLVVVLMPVLIGMAALTIDVGYMYNVRAELQSAADAAALAGADILDGGAMQVRTRAKAIAARHAGLAHFELRDEDVVLGRWDQTEETFTVLTGLNEAQANAVRVSATMSSARGNPVSTFFAGIFGRNSVDVAASATASFGSGSAWNVVIVQDVTASFGGDITRARDADQDLLDCIYGAAHPDSQVALVTFTGFGQVLRSWYYINDGYSTLKAGIASIKECGKSPMPKCSGTNIGAGLDAAIGLINSLDSDSSIPPSIVLVSDGEPQSSSSNPGYTDAQLKTWAIKSADKADDLGISIYTVFYSKGGSNSGEEFLADLVRGRGTAHSTPDPNQIAELLGAICKEGMKLMLVQ